MFSLTRSGLKSNFITHIHGNFLCPIRSVKLKVRPYAPVYENPNDKGKRLPKSPGLSIYKPQLTTILSLAHRFSGLALVSYTTAFGLNSLFCLQDFSAIITMIEGLELSSTTLMGMKFFISFPFALHNCCGIRHLLWDTGRCLTLKGVYTSGYSAALGAFVLAGIFSIL